MKNWIDNTFGDVPRFALLGLPAILIGLIALAYRIDIVMNFDVTNSRHLVATSFSVVVSIFCLTCLIILRMYSEMVKARMLAKTDELTGLINRREFNRILRTQLEFNQERGKSLGLIALDLDRFKVINDSYGHEAGDAIICQFGERIKSVLRGHDVICRISGDEFFVLLRDISHNREIENVGFRILNSMREPFIHNEVHILASTSLGSAFIGPEVESETSAMRMADFALLRSKEQGRNRLVHFDPEMAESIRGRRELELKLRQAIANKTLSTRYQPFINQESGEVTGVEALVRWIDNGKEISPAEFLPLAVELNLIEEIGTFVLERACEEIGPMSSMRLAVNISKTQFVRDNFVEQIDTILDETGFPASRLELEVPQALLAMNSSEVGEKLGLLRSRGIKIALDDFGTGYSNMMFLREFKLDRIKLDRSFIKRVTVSRDTSKMVDNMIELGNSLSKNVTVEGIETSEQLQRLQFSRFDEYQGFYFSKPMSALELQTKHSREKLNAMAKRLQATNKESKPSHKLSA